MMQKLTLEGLRELLPSFEEGSEGYKRMQEAIEAEEQRRKENTRLLQDLVTPNLRNARRMEKKTNKHRQADEIAHLKAEVSVYRRMLYDMTSLTDWKRHRYSEELYNEKNDEFESDEVD